MKAVLEIIVAMLAVFGGYTVLDMIRVRLLYPKKVRMRVRAAVVLFDKTELAGAADYARYLRREQKISSERLIILANDDIIKNSEDLSRCGEVFEYINCKESNDDAELSNGREES